MIYYVTLESVKVDANSAQTLDMWVSLVLLHHVCIATCVLHLSVQVSDYPSALYQ